MPPTITEEKFLDEVSPLPDYSEFYIGRGCTEYKESNFSRAYLTFKNFDDVVSFKNRFDGYVFVNDKGHDYTALVEFSPLQKVADSKDSDGARRKKDALINTIETLPEYVEFMDALKQPIQKSAISPDSILEEIQNRNAQNKTPQVTPLMEFIIKRREEERRKKREKKKKKPEEPKPKDNKEKSKEKFIKKETNNQPVTVLKAEKKEVKLQQKKNKPNKEQRKTEVPKYKVLEKKPADVAKQPATESQQPKPSTSTSTSEKVSVKTNSSTKQILKKSNEQSSSNNSRVKGKF